jgi:hypothetical protein
MTEQNGTADEVILQAPAAAKLRPKQERAIVSLMTNPTIEQAAAAAGVTSRAIRKWAKDPNFQAAYQSERRRTVDQALAQLQAGMPAAVAILLDAMHNAEDPGRRLRAANWFLRHALKAVEQLDLATQLKEIQATLESYREECRTAGRPFRGAGA